uniref:7TM GPCR serpentine receptor class x (Srx) domain-containing protein n=1 Tax=Strongyloides stercoralis TaxID=6248 RepID=A0A0K0E5I6_STRER
MESQVPVVRVCGWITVISCAIFIVIELTNLIILCRKKKLLKSNVVYLIITVLGFLDFGQQVIHLLSGIWCVVYWEPPFRLNMFLGAFVDFLYNLSIINGLILSINRFYIFFHFSDNINKIIKYIAGIMIILFTLIIILFFILHQFYYLRVYYDIDLATWNFVSTEENDYAYNYFENRLMTSINMASLVIFSLAMIKLFIQKFFNSSFSKNIQKYEYYIFIKAGLNFFCIFATQFLWEYGTYFWPNYNYLFTILNTLWVLTTGRDCCMNIIFLGEVRNDIVKFFTKSNSNTEKRKRNIFYTKKITIKVP